MGRVVHFEIPADDTSRAGAFYREVFGWGVERAQGAPVEYWLATTGADSELGINGAIMPRGGLNSETANTIGVSDINAALESVKAHGGEVVTPAGEIPGVGTFAYCRDTEGNLIGVLQPAPQAGQ